MPPGTWLAYAPVPAKKKTSMQGAVAGTAIAAFRGSLFPAGPSGSGRFEWDWTQWVSLSWRCRQRPPWTLRCFLSSCLYYTII